MPTTDTSSGTRSPRSRAALSTPIAISSEAQKIAVGGSSNKFDENGRLTDEAAVKFLKAKMEALRAAI